MQVPTIESKSTPDGRKMCELISDMQYGAVVYSVHVYETVDYIDYKEVYRSYPVGKERRARSEFKQHCNRWLRNKR